MSESLTNYQELKLKSYSSNEVLNSDCEFIRINVEKESSFFRENLIIFLNEEKEKFNFSFSYSNGEWVKNKTDHNIDIIIDVIYHEMDLSSLESEDLSEAKQYVQSNIISLLDVFNGIHLQLCYLIIDSKKELFIVKHKLIHDVVWNELLRYLFDIAQVPFKSLDKYETETSSNVYNFTDTSWLGTVDTQPDYKKHIRGYNDFLINLNSKQELAWEELKKEFQLSDSDLITCILSKLIEKSTGVPEFRVLFESSSPDYSKGIPMTFFFDKRSNGFETIKKFKELKECNLAHIEEYVRFYGDGDTDFAGQSALWISVSEFNFDDKLQNTISLLDYSLQYSDKESVPHHYVYAAVVRNKSIAVNFKFNNDYYTLFKENIENVFSWLLNNYKKWIFYNNNAHLTLSEFDLENIWLKYRNCEIKPLTKTDKIILNGSLNNPLSNYYEFKTTLHINAKELQVRLINVLKSRPILSRRIWAKDLDNAFYLELKNDSLICIKNVSEHFNAMFIGDLGSPLFVLNITETTEYSLEVSIKLHSLIGDFNTFQSIVNYFISDQLRFSDAPIKLKTQENVDFDLIDEIDFLKSFKSTNNNSEEVVIELPQEFSNAINKLSNNQIQFNEMIFFIWSVFLNRISNEEQVYFGVLNQKSSVLNPFKLDFYSKKSVLDDIISDNLGNVSQILNSEKIDYSNFGIPVDSLFSSVVNISDAPSSINNNVAVGFDLTLNVFSDKKVTLVSNNSLKLKLEKVKDTLLQITNILIEDRDVRIKKIKIEFTEVEENLHQSKNREKLIDDLRFAISNSIEQNIVSLEESFFDLGGNSLTALKCLSILNTKGYNLSVVEFFKCENFNVLINKMNDKDEWLSQKFKNYRHLSIGPPTHYQTATMDNTEVGMLSGYIDVSNTIDSKKTLNIIKLLLIDFPTLNYSIVEEKFELFKLKEGNPFPETFFKHFKESNSKKLNEINDLFKKFLKEDKKLWGLSLIELDESSYLLFTASHLICDATSYSMIANRIHNLVGKVPELSIKAPSYSLIEYSNDIYSYGKKMNVNLILKTQLEKFSGFQGNKQIVRSQKKNGLETSNNETIIVVSSMLNEPQIEQIRLKCKKGKVMLGDLIMVLVAKQIGIEFNLASLSLSITTSGRFQHEINKDLSELIGSFAFDKRLNVNLSNIDNEFEKGFELRKTLTGENDTSLSELLLTKYAYYIGSSWSNSQEGKSVKYIDFDNLYNIRFNYMNSKEREGKTEPIDSSANLSLFTINCIELGESIELHWEFRKDVVEKKVIEKILNNIDENLHKCLS